MLRKVVSIAGAGADPQIVDLARELLAQAERGELGSLVYMAEAIRPDGRPRVGVVGRWLRDPAHLLGELAIVKSRIAKVAAERKYG